MTSIYSGHRSVLSSGQCVTGTVLTKTGLSQVRKWSDLYSESGKIDIWERSRKIEISTVSIYLYQRMNVTVIFESIINKQCELSVQGRGQRVLGCP